MGIGSLAEVNKCSEQGTKKGMPQKNMANKQTMQGKFCSSVSRSGLSNFIVSYKMANMHLIIFLPVRR